MNANDFFFEVARGSRKGMSRVVLCGLNADVDAAEDVWDVGGDVPAFNVTGFALEIVSDDADDAPADTGALTITIKGVTIAGVYQEATVATNGVTPVAVPGTWGFVNSAGVATAGTSQGNEGTILVRIPAGATKCQIAPLHSISDGAFYYVPVGYRFILESLNFWSTTAGTTTIGIGRVRGGVFTYQAHMAMTNAAIQPAFQSMIQYLGGDLVKVRVSAVSAASQVVGATLRGVLLDSTAV